jgi:hypothetical protein
MRHRVVFTPTTFIPIQSRSEQVLYLKEHKVGPEVMFMDGLHRTIDWYIASREQRRVSAELETMLTER